MKAKVYTLELGNFDYRYYEFLREHYKCTTTEYDRFPTTLVWEFENEEDALAFKISLGKYVVEPR